MSIDIGRRRASDGTRIPRLAAALLALQLAACGGGGGSSIDDVGGGDLSLWEQRTEASDKLANLCAAPRSGTDPYNGNRPYPDRRGTLDNEKNWLKTYMNEVYLWYREIPSVSASPYTVANYGSITDALDAYFNALLTPRTTASGKLKDQFSFTYPTAQWDALSQGGISVGYGMQVALLANVPPRRAVVAYADPGTPASASGIARGAEITAIDGVDLVNDNSNSGIATLNAGLFPSREGEQHTFTLRDRGAGSARSVTLTAQQVTSTPVQNVRTLATATGQVGYLLFNDHIATAEGQLIRAITQLRDAGVSDLILDLRYNGGGYLDIAGELAYMIAGAARTSGKAFETLSFNDKNPLARSADIATPFYTAAVGFDPGVASGTPLPTLGLGRVYVLTGGGTCSASESIVNGLRGVDVNVVLIGDSTCGKPYGFYAQDNCGLSYLAIEFAGVNAKGFGDYADGFTPDCAVADDFSHALGDADEALTAAALNYRSSGSCASADRRASARASAAGPQTEAPVTVQLLRTPMRENRYLNHPR